MTEKYKVFDANGKKYEVHARSKLHAEQVLAQAKPGIDIWSSRTYKMDSQRTWRIDEEITLD